MGTPAAEVEIDDSLVRTLLRTQHPDLCDLPLRRHSSGFDNVIYRLGDEWCLRLPRRKLAVPLLENEQRWVGELAPNLPIAVPTAARVGVAAPGYPWPWSILPWLPGETADRERLGAQEPRRLVDFLLTLHRSAPRDAPFNQWRGVPIATRRQAVQERTERVRRASDSISGASDAIWQAALAAPGASHRRWLHGDLHPRNVLVHKGRISGIIDWGDMAAGDVATDLAAFWMLLDDAPERRRAVAQYMAETDLQDDALLLRAAGWAVMFATFLLDAGLVDDPAHAAVGRATLARLATDAPHLLGQ